MLLIPLLLLAGFAQLHADWACGSARSANLLYTECVVDRAPGLPGQDLVPAHVSPLVVPAFVGSPAYDRAVSARVDALLKEWP